MNRVVTLTLFNANGRRGAKVNQTVTLLGATKVNYTVNDFLGRTTPNYHHLS